MLGPLDAALVDPFTVASNVADRCYEGIYGENADNVTVTNNIVAFTQSRGIIERGGKVHEVTIT